MIREAIFKAAAGENLEYAEAEAVMDEIMSGKASEIQMSSFLTAMSMKGETINEITASAVGMRKHCVKLLNNIDALEIVGTGGDHANTFNISTTSAIVISAAGIPVAKHGNRAASSKSGAADGLEALGANISISPKQSLELLGQLNFCFLFAQNYHLAMKYVAPVRRELGIRTIFNILGPLVNPAGANMELLGVYAEELVEPLAQVLANLGVKNAMVVFGLDGLDELSISSDTKVCEIRNGDFKNYVIRPEDYGFRRCDKSELVGGTPAENAKITRDILSGKEKGAKLDAVLLNAAAAIYIAQKDSSISNAIKTARELIENGSALKQLEDYVRLSSAMENPK
jgi:anthranilate phosphoribosyltransferase